MQMRSEIEKALDALFSARRRNDAKASAAAFGPDCRFRIVGDEALGALTAEVRGADRLSQMLHALCAEWDFSNFETVTTHIDGDFAYCYRKGEIRHFKSGAVFATEILDRAQFRDGSIVDFLEFIDTYKVARLTGAV